MLQFDEIFFNRSIDPRLKAINRNCIEIQIRVIKSLLPLCHVSKWVLQSVTNWPSAFIVVLTRKWKLKDLRSLSASNRYLFYGFLQNDRWKEVLLWLLAVHSVAFMFKYREKMTKFEKKSYTVFSNYLVTSTQIGRFFSKFCGLLRISELYWPKHICIPK